MVTQRAEALAGAAPTVAEFSGVQPVEVAKHERGVGSVHAREEAESSGSAVPIVLGSPVKLMNFQGSLLSVPNLYSQHKVFSENVNT